MKTIFKSTLVLFMLAQLSFGYSFTYSGPSYATINFGSSSTSATFYFTYEVGENENIVDPRLAIVVDGSLVSGSYFDRGTPSSYTITGLSPGVHTIEFALFSLGNGNDILHQEEETTISVRVKVKVQNNFIGGDIYVDNLTSSKTSPYHRTSSKNSNFIVGAIDQTYNGYNHIWNTNGTNDSDWRDDKGNGFYLVSTSRNTTYTVADWNTNTTVQANLRKVCNITFTNNFNGTNETETITVDGQSYPAPTSNFTVVDQNTITATAGGFEIDDVLYKFSHWDTNIADSFSIKTFTATSHFNHVANFIGTAQSDHLNLSFNSYNPRVQEFVTLYWDELASTGITKYYIWRKMNGVNAEIIGSVNRGTTTFTDSDYYRSANGTNINIGYGIQAYFQPDNTYSSVWYSYANGESSAVSKLVLTDSTSNEPPKVVEFSLNTNYPNPFNPSTQISYQLPENSFVNLIVYNALGQEVAMLVNQQQPSGKYTVQFNASSTGGGLPSGVYIYKLQAGQFTSTKKMLLTK